jgi:serine/threonine protein kinase
MALSDVLRLNEVSSSYPRLNDFFSIGLQLFAALHHLHYLGSADPAAAERLGRPHIVHGDITPDNVLCVGDRYKLSDVACGGRITASSGLGSAQISETGTLDYCAPEVTNGMRPTRASDVYSLGAVLFRVLTGTLPDHDQLYLPEKPRLLSVFFPRILDRNPEQRLNALNAHALLEQFGNYR